MGQADSDCLSFIIFYPHSEKIRFWMNRTSQNVEKPIFNKIMLKTDCNFRNCVEFNSRLSSNIAIEEETTYVVLDKYVQKRKVT